MAKLSSQLILSLVDKVSGPARAVHNTIGRLERSAVQMGTASRMALAGAAGALAPIAGAYGASSVVREAADFESALTGIQKKAGITADQTAQLGKEIMNLATSGELAVPLEEIASAYERGAAAGIPLDQLRQFALLSAKAADAFEMSAEDVGNTAAGLNKALGVPMERMESIFDLINGLADSGIADESGIVDFVDSAGAMGKTFGMTVEQTAALGATLANLKVPAGEAATAVNSILTKLLAPKSLSKKGFSAFKRLVGDTDEFAKKVSEDADGALVDLITKLKTLDSASRTGVIADLFGQEHVDVVSQLVEGSDELVRNLQYAADTKGWAGSLNNSYQLKLDDFWSQWTVARNTLRELMVDAGNMAMPFVKSGLEEAKVIFDEIGKGMETLKVEVDAASFQEAKKALGELRDMLASILTMGNEGTAIESFFQRMAALTNTLTGSIKTIREFGQEVGVIGEDTPDQGPLGSARETIRDAGVISPPLRAVDKVIDLATGQNQDPAKIDAMRQDLEALERDAVDDDYYSRRWGEERPRVPQTAPTTVTPAEVPKPVVVPVQVVPEVSPISLPEVDGPIPTPRPDTAVRAEVDIELGNKQNRPPLPPQPQAVPKAEPSQAPAPAAAPAPVAAPAAASAAPVPATPPNGSTIDHMLQGMENLRQSSATPIVPTIDTLPAKMQLDQAAVEMKAAMQIQGAAQMDTSALDVAISKARTLLSLMQQAGAAASSAASARLDTSGLHADVSRAGF